jgi:hypothetical protein
MKAMKGTFIFLAMAVMIVFNTQPALGGSACYPPDGAVGCIFTSVVPDGGLFDSGFRGTAVSCTMVAYYEPTQTEEHIVPATCAATGYKRCCPSPTVSCPSLCPPEPEGYLMVVVRAQVGKKGSPQEFLMEVDTASLTGDPDPCDSSDFRDAANKDKCKCKRDFAIENGLDSVPVCMLDDSTLQEDLFRRFIRTTMIPALFPGTPNAPFAVTSVSNYAINDESEPFYGILDLELQVLE